MAGGIELAISFGPGTVLSRTSRRPCRETWRRWPSSRRTEVFAASRLVTAAKVVHSSPPEEDLMDDAVLRFRQAADRENRRHHCGGAAHRSTSNRLPSIGSSGGARRGCGRLPRHLACQSPRILSRCGQRSLISSDAKRTTDALAYVMDTSLVTADTSYSMPGSPRTRDCPPSRSPHGARRTSRPP